MKFRIHRVNDDEDKFFIDGKHVGGTDYDTHGSQGMRDMYKLFRDIAAEVGAELEETEGGEE